MTMQLQVSTNPRRNNAFSARKHRILRILFLITIVMSGAVQFFNIFILAGINLVLWYLVYLGIGFKFDRRTRYLGAFLLLYLSYSLAISNQATDLKYIAFRFHDFLTATLFINYLLVKNVNFEKLFDTVFTWLIIYGFINFFMTTFFFGFFRQIPHEVSFRFLIFFGREETYYGIHRSQNIFWEPGVAQLYLNIYLYYAIFYKKSLRAALVAFVSIALTLSTTGVIIAAVQYIVYFKQKSKSLGGLILKIAILLPFLAMYISFASDIVTDKVSGTRIGSFWARSFDTENGALVALSNPLGIGFNPEKYQEIARSNPFNIKTFLVTDRGQTNSIVRLFYTTGFFWAIVLLYFTYKQKIFSHKRLLLFFILMLSLSTEPLFFSPFVLLFPMSGMLKARSFFIARSRS